MLQTLLEVDKLVAGEERADTPDPLCLRLSSCCALVADPAAVGGGRAAGAGGGPLLALLVAHLGEDAVGCVARCSLLGREPASGAHTQEQAQQAGEEEEEGAC